MAVIVQDLQNPKVRKFLQFLGKAEGTQGYDRGFGNDKLTSLKDHPRKKYRFGKNKDNITTAAGLYQITQGTWDEFAKKVGVKDFSPQSQDLVALAIIDSEGALNDVRNGNYQAAIGKLGNRWASLPSSIYDQPKRSNDFVNKELGLNLPMNAFGANVASSPTLDRSQMPQLNAPDVPGIDAQAPLNPLTPLITDGTGLDTDSLNTDIDTFQPYTFGSPENEPWEDKFMQMAMQRDLSNARESSIAQFLGNDYVEDRPLPRQIERSINKIVGNL